MKYEREQKQEQDPSADIWTSEWIEFQPEAVAESDARPDNRPCEPWDTPVIRLNADDIARRIQHTYPTELRNEGIGGSVQLALFVEVSGEPVKYEILESSGHEVLDVAASDVSMGLRFEPAKRLGRPVAVWISQRLTFAVAKQAVVNESEYRIPSSCLALVRSEDIHLLRGARYVDDTIVSRSGRILARCR